MLPERTAVLLLLSALLLSAACPAVLGAGGPPEHSNADATAIEAAGKQPGDDTDTAPGKSGAAPGQNKDKKARDTPEPTPTGTAGEAPRQPGQTIAEPFPWAWMTLALIILGGASVLGAVYLQKSRGADAGGDPGATILPGAYRTTPSHPAGFPPKLAERYDRVAFVGRGGLGQVFRAVRRDDGREVAVKIPVTYDEATGRTFMKEMRFWEDLTHPNIVAVYSVNILPVPFVEMEYLPRTLGDVEKPLPVETAARIAAGIAAGLAYAHERGVIHRDIKPGNILLAGDLSPKITDWGMSTTLEASRDTTVAGFTLAYAAPEQIAPERFGRTDAWTDIYQLGIVFYELVTGKTPFADENLAGFAGAVLHEQPAPPSLIKEGLAELDPIILRCLAKDPADRYQSARELLDAIETLMWEAGDTTLT
jgi:hypothetical protein